MIKVKIVLPLKSYGVRSVCDYICSICKLNKQVKDLKYQIGEQCFVLFCLISTS